MMMAAAMNTEQMIPMFGPIETPTYRSPALTRLYIFRPNRETVPLSTLLW